VQIELLNRLSGASFLDDEVGGREIGYERAVLAVHDDVHFDEIRSAAKQRWRLRRILRSLSGRRRYGPQSRGCADDCVADAHTFYCTVNSDVVS
jgi:hypothetical protein